MSLRIATFNVENLMARFDFSGWRQDRRRDPTIALHDVSSEREYRHLEQARVIAHADDARQMTALAIADCRADILCLQEVEDLNALEAFETNYLYRMTGISYPLKVWKQGNDGRGIDVALMAREKDRQGRPIEILNVKSHAGGSFKDFGVHTRQLAEMGFGPTERLFRRDCLEVDLSIGGRRLTVFTVHYKSMGGSKENGVTGRDYTMPLRFAEAMATRRIIERKFGPERAAKMRWLVCGDLNDYRERLAIDGNRDKGYRFTMLDEPVSALEPLLGTGFSDNLVERRARENRWTLYHAAGPVSDMDAPEERDMRHLVQLDYLLASPSLARANPKAVPDIIRNGMPFRTIFPPEQDVERYPRTGWDRPKASDHCPVAVTLDMR